MSTSLQSKPDYGIDAPTVVRNLIVIGVVLLAVGIFVTKPLQLGPVLLDVTWMGRIGGAFCLLEGLAMIFYAKVGKFHHRDRMLNMVPWRGDEQVLDVGTGRGLLMIGAGKRLTTGRSTGIDVWSKKDLSGNVKGRTERNAELEGVTNRVEVLDGDATRLNFPDNTFDVVLSNLCIHNIPGRENRDQACREIVRVLKPGGTALISDFINTGRYNKIFREAGTSAERGSLDLFTFPWLRIVKVEKP